MERILTGEANYAKIAEHLYERAKSQQSQFGKRNLKSQILTFFNHSLKQNPTLYGTI